MREVTRNHLTLGSGPVKVAVPLLGKNREELFAGQVGIVFGEQRIVELHHLESAHAESFFLEAREHFAHQRALYGAGFEENESFFECHNCRLLGFGFTIRG